MSALALRTSAPLARAAKTPAITSGTRSVARAPIHGRPVDTYALRSAPKTSSSLPGLPTPPSSSGSYHVPGWVVGGSILAGAAALSMEKKDTTLSELPAEMVERALKPHSWKRKIKIGENATTGITLSEHLIAGSDSKIQDDPIRKKTTKDLSVDGAVVGWLEAEGLMELGAKANGQLSLNWLAKGEAGFSGNGLVSYRVMTPLAAKSHADLSTDIRVGTFALPVGRAELLKVAPGTEFELSGHGTVKGKAAVKAHGSKLGELLNAGFRAEAHGQMQWEGNLKVRVRVLDNAGNIEVQIQQDTHQSQTLAASLEASLTYDESRLQAWGDNRVGKLAAQAGHQEIKSWWKSHKDSSLRVQSEGTQKVSELGRFVLNVNGAQGLEAYQQLLRLDLDAVERVSATPENGVSSYRSHESSTRNDYKLDLDVAGYKLLLSRALESERTHEVRRDGELVELERSNELEVTAGNFIAGYENIKWGAVTAYDPKTNQESTFYNLLYSNDDRITMDQEVDGLFRFAKALDVEYDHASRREVDESWNIFRWFSSSDNTKVDVDMYFTRLGVDRVVASSSDDARRAILSACSKFHPHLKGIENISEEDFHKSLEYVRELRNLQEAVNDEPGSMMMIGDNYYSRLYSELTGRDLFMDADALETASAFMIHKDALAEDAGEDSQRRFFVELGREQRFRFMPAILALTELAGREHLMVNALSMHGEKIDLEAKSEGVTT